jgi:hypothetical protein
MKQTCHRCDGKLTRHDSYRRVGQRKLTRRYRCLVADVHRRNRRGNGITDLGNESSPTRSLSCPVKETPSEESQGSLGSTPKRWLAIRSAWPFGPSKRSSSSKRRTAKRSQRSFLDEAITFEHTRCKPVAVSVATSEQCHLLGFSVAEMPAIGKHLKKISVEKYGPRKNRRRAGVRKTLKDASPMIAKDPKVVTDEEVSYGPLIRRQFGEGVEHTTHKAIRSSVAGQGEMKTRGFDPLFPVNHSLARMRDGVSSMVRKTWATAKRVWSLINHLLIFMAYHNRRVVSQLEKKRRKTHA